MLKAKPRTTLAQTFLEAAYKGDIDFLRPFLNRRIRSAGFTSSYYDPPDINTRHPVTGMTALHLAVGRDNLAMTKLLVEAGAKFIPDNEGRMPSVIAAEMEVSDELADYIVEAEANALKGEKPEGV